MATISKDTTLCISLSGRPSNIGTRFHNHLYAELGLDFVYKAFSTDDLAGAIAGVRALGIRGCSVSMPFKEDVIALVDELEESVAAIGSVNTIVNDSGRLVASNTDVEAVAELLTTHAVDPALPVLLRGSGGMAKAVLAAFHGAGFADLTVLARNAEAGERLAAAYEARFVTEPPPPGPGVLVNVTPLGMTGPDAEVLAFVDEHVAAARMVFDAVALPVQTPLIRAAEAVGVPVITGAEVIALQAAHQFARYTGVTPSPEQVRRASALSRE